MAYESQFILMVNCNFKLDKLVNLIKKEWKDIRWIKSYSFDMKGNWIQISANEDYDISCIKDKKDGYLYYKYRLEVSPLGDIKNIDNQVTLAMTLKSRFTAIGCVTEICADFEELL